MSKANILVTGGCGFLGWNLAVDLSAHGYHVICFDFSDTPPFPSCQNSEIHIQIGKIENMSDLLKTIQKHNISRIIHGAAIVGYGPTACFPYDSLKVNIKGTLNVLEAARIYDLKRIIFLSSEEVYGEFQKDPAPETHPFAPIGIYAITKSTAEGLINFYRAEYGLNKSFIIRTSWVYGPGLPKDREPWVMVRKGVSGDPYSVPYGADQFSDKTYIDDFIQGAKLILGVKDPVHRIFNIGSGTSTSLQEMVDIVKEISPQARLEIGPGLWHNSEQVKMPQKGALDITRAKELGYQPDFDLKKGLKTWISSNRF